MVTVPSMSPEHGYRGSQTTITAGCTMDNQIADGKSVLGLMAIDYKKPVKVVSEDRRFLKQLDRWAVDKDL